MIAAQDRTEYPVKRVRMLRAAFILFTKVSIDRIHASSNAIPAGPQENSFPGSGFPVVWWRESRDRNRFDNAADWLDVGLRVARRYFSKTCNPARRAECWCRYSVVVSAWSWTRQCHQIAADHFQGRERGSRYPGAEQVHRWHTRWRMGRGSR